jgi:hypothetical protein
MVSGKEDGLTSFSTDVIVVPQHPHGGASSWKPLSIFYMFRGASGERVGLRCSLFFIR